MPSSAFTDLFTYLTQLMMTHSAMFETLGNRLYGAFTVIIVVWFGIQWALRGGIQMERFASLMLSISFGFAMTRFYSAPIPGFGVSFYHLIIDEGKLLADALNANMVQMIADRLDAVIKGMEVPGMSIAMNILEVFRWSFTILLIAAVEAGVFFVVSFGYIAMAISVLLGPVFIPFFIVPKMEWLFWGWLRALLQYSFYPVVANAYVFVFGNLIINFVDRAGTDYAGGNLAALLVPLWFLLIAFIFGLVKIPSLVNSLFTGKSGESAVPNILS